MEKPWIVSIDRHCDLAEELCEKFNIVKLPLYVALGDDLRRDNNVTLEEMFDYYLESGCFPKTSAISPYDYEEFFYSAIKKGCNVLHVNMSSSVSSCCNNCTIAIANVECDRRVWQLDAGCVSSCVGIVAIKASQMLQKGFPVEQVISVCGKLRSRLETHVFLTGEKFLSHGGRATLEELYEQEFCFVCFDYIQQKVIEEMSYCGDASAALKYFVSSCVQGKNIEDAVFVDISVAPSHNVQLVVDELKMAGFNNIYVQTAVCGVAAHWGTGAIAISFCKENE